MTTHKLLGFSFYIELPNEISGKPQVQNITNKFDLHGSLVSLRRITGETNQEYRNRLWDVNVHPSGSLYEGVVNGIARALGMLREQSLYINLKTTSSGEAVALSPRVDFLANRVVLYSDWRPNGIEIIDKEIRTYKLGDPGYYLDDLIMEINESDCFHAELIGAVRPNTISNTLVRTTSNAIVRDEYIRTDKLTQLEHLYIVKDSVTFLEKNIFQTEVENEPEADGEYMIDYRKGEIQCYTLPSGLSSCSYYAAIFPMRVDTVPVQIFTLQDDDFQDELFNKKELDSGVLVNALPNTEGSEIYHQLFKETEVFWGE